ncbi:MAG: hypothetical protein L0221_08900 [Chloroflexi bacterium]|nr:hypothetical protein [Chloroflexota bacterium]
MTLANLWRFLAVALPALGALIANLPSVDLAYHLRAGAEIVETGSIPTTDTWTYTVAGAPWFDQQWLAQAVLATTYKLGGWNGLAILRAGLVAATFGCLALAIGRRNPGLGPRTVALLVIAAFGVSAVALGLRPQLFGLALFALTLLLLELRRDSPRAVWAIPLVAALWANLHGSFVLAPLLCGLAWLEDVHDRAPRRHELLLVGLVSVALAALNPAGFGVWTYAAGLASNPSLSARVTEWQPTTLDDGPGLLFWASVAAVVVILARARRRATWPNLLWLGAFGYLGLAAVRGLAWWPLVAALIVASLLEPDPAPAPRTLRPSPLNAVLAATIGLVMLMLLPAWRPFDPQLRAPAGVVGNAPGGITAHLLASAAPGDRLWAPQPWGSWFEFALPDLPVATDSRIELFPESVWREYDQVESGSTAGLAVLDRYDVTIVVAAREQTALSEALAATDAWAVAYRDDDGAVFVRANGEEAG